jgi:hypothetical protein
MVGGPEEAEKAFSDMVSQRADAVVVQGSLAVKAVTDMAIKYRLPAASTARAFVEIGGLMSFGADGPIAFRHGAKFVQRILQGKQPRDIPIEQPTKFELAINLKTAKAMAWLSRKHFCAASMSSSNEPMSAIGPKRTFVFAPHMSAFGGKADMTIAACLLFRSLLGVKRTSHFAAQMSANDPKRT